MADSTDLKHAMLPLMYRLRAVNLGSHGIALTLVTSTVNPHAKTDVLFSTLSGGASTHEINAKQ